MNTNPFLVRMARLVALIALSYSLPCLCYAQDAAMESSPLFSSNELLQVRLEGPMTSIIREQTKDEAEGFPAKLSVVTPAGVTQTVDVKVRVRGHYRRQRRVCRYPPLFLDFPKKKVSGTIFAGQNKIKLVTHCQKKDRYEQLLLQEYLAYRVYNIVTDKSFRVRLLQITYVDTDKKNKQIVYHGFLIEHKRRLAKRLGETALKVSRVQKSKLDMGQASILSVFQYLIGNTDWSMIGGAEDDDCCHNAIPMADSEGVITPIPYDFDFAGVVNAPYAEPNPKLKIKRVRQRLYRGFCEPETKLENTLALFNEKKTSIYALYKNQEGLEERSAATTLQYFDDFYEVINNPKKVNRRIIKDCR